MEIIGLLGFITLFVLIFVSACILTILTLLAVALKTGRAYFPNLMVLLLIALEGPVKAVFRFFGLDDVVVDKTLIDLRNKLLRQRFAETAFNQRALFLPQCLRHTECPAKLSPEGIQCLKCGRCVVGDVKKRSEELGYKVFVVPGSSFIRRMIVEHRPAAIVGVGCRHEVKGGLEICDKYKVPAQGVVLQKSGCVSTIVDVEELLEVIGLKAGAAAVRSP
jgi:hypothetical protein